jgi:hypothetical protein
VGTNQITQVFPDWTVREKENFDTIKKGIAKDITGNVISNLHWLSELPIFVYRRDIDGLPRGKGIKTFYYPRRAHFWKIRVETVKTFTLEGLHVGSESTTCFPDAALVLQEADS